jgi:hypothetical protein
MIRFRIVVKVYPNDSSRVDKILNSIWPDVVQWPEIRWNTSSIEERAQLKEMNETFICIYGPHALDLICILSLPTIR